MQRRDKEGLRLHLHGHWCDSCVSRLHRALLDAEVRLGTLRLRSGRAVRSAVPSVAIQGDVPRVGRQRRDSDPSRPAVPVRQRRRGRKADGALGCAGVLRATCAGHPDLPGDTGARREGYGHAARPGGRDQPAQGSGGGHGCSHCAAGMDRHPRARDSEVCARGRGDDLALRRLSTGDRRAGRLHDRRQRQ